MRDIRVGDRVKFLNDTGSGIIVDLIDKEMVLVRTDEDDFEYPVLKKELLVRREDEEPEELENTEDREELEEIEKPEKAEVLEMPEKIEKPEKPEELEKPEKPERLKERKNKSIEEVDLHISEIMDDVSGLSSGEIVDIQLARFRTALEGALRAKQKKIIFIHGKGAGKLKREIHKIIDSEYGKCTYQDASFREYGYGATMILIK